MSRKELWLMGILWSFNYARNNPKVRSVTRKGAIKILQEMLTLYERGQYLAVISKEELADLFAEVRLQKLQMSSSLVNTEEPLTRSSSEGTLSEKPLAKDRNQAV